MASNVAESEKTETDHMFSVAAVVDRALYATETSVSAVASAVGVSATVVRRWLAEDRDDAPNLRHLAAMPLRLRQAILYPLLSEPDPVPSLRWVVGELGRLTAELAGCMGDETAGGTLDRIGAELMWIGSRLRAGRGGKQ